jgi:hypothetical protein
MSILKWNIRTAMVTATLFWATTTVWGQSIIKKDPPKQNDPKSNDKISANQTRTIIQSAPQPTAAPSTPPNRDPASSRTANISPRGLLVRPGEQVPIRPVAPSSDNRAAQQKWQRDEQWQRDKWEREQDERDRRDRDQDERDRRDAAYRNAESNNANAPGNNYFSGTGVLVGVGKDQLQVKANGSLWHVVLDQFAEAEVDGIAGTDALRPGLVVKLRGKFASKGNNQLETVDPISALEIINPHAGETPGSMKPFGDDANPNAGGNQQPKTTRSLTVVGTIVKYAKGQLTADLNGTLLKADLDPAAVIQVRGSDVGIARPRDQVDVAGYYLRPGYAVAQHITVTLSNPIGHPLAGFANHQAPGKQAANPAVAKNQKPAGG